MGPFSNMFLFVYDIAGMSLFFQEQFSKLGVNSPLIMRLDIITGLQHYFDGMKYHWKFDCQHSV